MSIVVILTSSFAIMGARGFGQALIRWHVMPGNHLAMAAIQLRYSPRLKAGAAVQDWHAAGAAMNRIRVLVATNLLFEALTIVAVTLGTCVGRESVRSP